jgi:hypothetical protein
MMIYIVKYVWIVTNTYLSSIIEKLDNIDLFNLFHYLICVFTLLNYEIVSKSLNDQIYTKNNY